jgi:Calcium-binding EGF domain
VLRSPLLYVLFGSRPNVVRGKCNSCPCKGDEVCDVSTNLCKINCPPGFRVEIYKGVFVCFDFDECMGFCKYGQTCTYVSPGFSKCSYCPCSAPNERCDWTTDTCVCQSGFERDSAGKCVDIDECRRAALNSTDICGFSKTCNNTAGSFACIACPCEGCMSIAFLSTCTCAPGFFRPAPNATEVINITKAVNITNPVNVTSEDTVTRPTNVTISPNVTATINVTTTANITRVVNVTTTINVTVPTPVPQPRNCTDIDECAVTPNICGSGKVCKNVVGTYVCTDAQS